MALVSCMEADAECEASGALGLDLCLAPMMMVLPTLFLAARFGRNQTDNKDNKAQPKKGNGFLGLLLLGGLMGLLSPSRPAVSDAGPDIDYGPALFINGGHRLRPRRSKRATEWLRRQNRRVADPRMRARSNGPEGSGRSVNARHKIKGPTAMPPRAAPAVPPPSPMTAHKKKGPVPTLF